MGAVGKYDSNSDPISKNSMFQIVSCSNMELNNMVEASTCNVGACTAEVLLAPATSRMYPGTRDEPNFGKKLVSTHISLIQMQISPIALNFGYKTDQNNPV